MTRRLLPYKIKRLHDKGVVCSMWTYSDALGRHWCEIKSIEREKPNGAYNFYFDDNILTSYEPDQLATIEILGDMAENEE